MPALAHRGSLLEGAFPGNATTALPALLYCFVVSLLQHMQHTADFVYCIRWRLPMKPSLGAGTRPGSYLHFYTLVFAEMVQKNYEAASLGIG